jgi:hypothetical protein
MNRDEWIDRARKLLEGNPEASELLEGAPDAPTVIVVEAEEIEELPARQAAPEPARRPPSRALVRGARFARKLFTEPEARLYGTERVEVAAHQITERVVDRGMDALEGAVASLPTLSDRGAAWSRRRLGTGKGF